MDKRLRGAARARPVAVGSRRRRPWLIGGALVFVLVAVGLTWGLWPEGSPDPRARVYTEATACLLTPAGGVVDKYAAPVWAGMQQASLATHGKVQYLEVDGPQTGENAKTYLATLIAGKCDLVLTAGEAPNAALAGSAVAYPKLRFVLVGKGQAQGNVSVLDAAEPSQVTERVRTVVTAALEASTAD